MIEVTEEYRKIAQIYKNNFGYGVPLSMIPPTTEMSDLIAKIQECIDEGEDTLLDKFGISVGENDLI